MWKISKDTFDENKGYSLIEVLGVITILSIIILLVFGSVNSYIENSDRTVDKITEENISKAAILYTKEYSSELNGWHYEYNEDGSVNLDSTYYCLPIQELVNKGYFSKEISKHNINLSSYIKVTKDENSKTYNTSGLILQEGIQDICKEYIITFVDRNNNVIKINNELQKKVVTSGYTLMEDDFPSTQSTSYYQFSEGNSIFFHNGKWENQEGNNVSAGYEIKNDTIIKIKYSLKTGSGTAYLLSKGQQRPFDGEGDNSSRYEPLSGSGSIELTDDGGTSLADFVQECHDTGKSGNCVLGLDAITFNNYLSFSTKNLLEEKGAGRNIEWYVLKYVSGTWHLDGQEYSPINIGFINPNEIVNDTDNDKNSCLNWNNNCKLSFTIYDTDIELEEIKITYSNLTTTTYTSDSLVKKTGKTNVFSNGLGFYLDKSISVSRLNQVTIKYKKGTNYFQSVYTYNYNNGIYKFKLISN